MNRRTALVVMCGAIGLVGLLLSVGLYLGIRVGKSLSTHSNPPRFQDSAVVLRQIQSLSELVTVKFVIEKVIVMEDATWFGENRLILVVRGVAKAGFDLKKIQSSNLQLQGTNLVIRLPKAQITDVYLDERRTDVIERSTGLLRTMDKNLETEARRHAIDRIRAGAIEAGILKEAHDRAITQLTMLAQQLGYGNTQVQATE